MSYHDRVASAGVKLYYDHHAKVGDLDLWPSMQWTARRAAHIAAFRGWLWGFIIGWVLGCLGLATYWSWK